MKSLRQRDIAAWNTVIRITLNSFTCHHPAAQSSTPGVSTSMIPNSQVAIIAGFMICFSSRRSITLKRALSALPAGTWQ